MNIIDQIIERTIELKSPIVVGLDPVIDKIPLVYHKPYISEKNEFKKISNIVFDFNKDIIDSIYNLVPAIKPQMAFYEMYGSYGIQAFERTVTYAKEKGLIVIEDAKRNDIGNTALAYANGHLGRVTTTTQPHSNFDVDFLTVSPYLGKESLTPFVDICKQYNKGIFILVKTSNKGNEDIQNATNQKGEMLHEIIAQYVDDYSKDYLGQYDYSPIGAVVGATYPKEATKLRKRMPHSYFLVPGYGAQGGKIQDIISCFNEDGLGALINSSRGIIYHYEKDYDLSCTKDEYKLSIIDAITQMQKDIYLNLKENFLYMNY